MEVKKVTNKHNENIMLVESLLKQNPDKAYSYKDINTETMVSEGAVKAIINRLKRQKKVKRFLVVLGKQKIAHFGWETGNADQVAKNIEPVKEEMAEQKDNSVSEKLPNL